MSLSEQKSLVYADACARVIAYNTKRVQQLTRDCKAIHNEIPARFKKFKRIADYEQAKQYRKRAKELQKGCEFDKNRNLHDVCSDLYVDSNYVMRIINGN